MTPAAAPLSRCLESLRPTAVNSILAEVRQLQSSGRTLFPLMRGEPDFRTPDHITEAAVKALREGRTSYPDNRGEMKLRQAVAAKLKRDNSLTYSADTEILVTTGATLGIFCALAAVLNPGDHVLVPDPIYDAYLSPIRLTGAEPVLVPSSIEGGRFRLTIDALEQPCTPNCRALLLNSPWNPTGTVFTGEELAAITSFCLRRNLYLISDEIYEAITYGESRHISPASLGPEINARTILVNSLSKTYAMTGWRVGYCAAPAALTQAMFLILQQSSRGPATFVQDAAAEALAGNQDCVAVMRQEYTRRRTLVLDRLASLPHCKVLAPEGGFFAMLDARELGIPSNEIRQRLLQDYGVVVVHGAAYGAAGEGTLRVAFATGGEALERGLDQLHRGLSEMAR